MTVQKTAPRFYLIGAGPARLCLSLVDLLSFGAQYKTRQNTNIKCVFFCISQQRFKLPSAHHCHHHGQSFNGRFTVQREPVDANISLHRLAVYVLPRLEIDSHFLRRLVQRCQRRGSVASMAQHHQWHIAHTHCTQFSRQFPHICCPLMLFSAVAARVDLNGISSWCIDMAAGEDRHLKNWL